jgi:ABC-type nitrate/sulfonate/bicarbonate transport system substrate-binding protein
MGITAVQVSTAKEEHMGLRLAGFFALVFLAPLLAAVGPGEPQQKELKKVHLNIFTPDPVIIAGRAKGFFAAEGVEVPVTVTRSSTEQMRGLSNGTFQVASTAFDNVLAWSGREGAEIVAVVQSADTILLPVYARPEIKSWSDLKGKKLAVDAVDTAFALTLRRILQANGLDMKRGDYELVAVGAPGPRLESMKKGETFAGIINQPFDVQAAQAGMVRLDYPQATVLKDYPGTVMAVSRAWAQANRKELVGFIRAWLASLRWVKDPANRAEATKLVAAETKLPPQVAAGLASRVPKDGALSLAGLQTVISLRNEFGTPPPMGPSVERYYDLSYYEEAAKR